MGSREGSEVARYGMCSLSCGELRTKLGHMGLGVCLIGVFWTVKVVSGSLYATYSRRPHVFLVSQSGSLGLSIVIMLGLQLLTCEQCSDLGVVSLCSFMSGSVFLQSAKVT